MLSKSQQKAVAAKWWSERPSHRTEMVPRGTKIFPKLVRRAADGSSSVHYGYHAFDGQFWWLAKVRFDPTGKPEFVRWVEVRTQLPPQLASQEAPTEKP